MRQRHRSQQAQREGPPPPEADPSTAQISSTTNLEYPLMDRRFDSNGPIPMKTLAIGTILAFLVMLPVGSHVFSQYRQQLREGERFGAACGSVAFGCIIAHFLVNRLVSSPRYERNMDVPIMAIMFVAGLSNLIMATCDVPVVIDPITGCQVHLLRWTEWTVLTFTMSYTICDFWPYVPKPKHEATVIENAIAFSVIQTAASSCGFIFPFAPNGFVYAILFSFAFCCYLVCTVPLYQRWLQLSEVRARSPNTLAASAARLCFYVSLAVCVTWTMFVINYVAQASLDLESSIPFVVDVVVDVISKLLLAGLVVQLQDAVVVEQERQHQYQTERLMSKIWKYCGDIFIVENESARGQLAEPLISPAIGSVVGLGLFPDQAGITAAGLPNLIQAAKVAWEKHDSRTSYVCFPFDLMHTNGSIVHCEVGCAKVGNSELSAQYLMVARDITDRIERQKAETLLELRNKDVESNRFARHEIKNGMLNCINLMRGITEMLEQGVQSALFVSDDYAKDVICHCSTLQEELDGTLSTVLCDALIRELHHGDYSPRLEPMSLQDFLTKLFIKWSNCVLDFEAMVEQPLMLDQFLLKIYVQNAVSNGMKYGKKGGIITFIVKLHLGLLTILCRNEAGDGQDMLVGMTEEQVSTMFNKGTRLDLGDEADIHRDISSGDGAWLMQACARAMGGECSIRFSENHTDLTMVCSTNVSVTEAQAACFEIPKGTYLIVMDDSSLQRKAFARQMQTHFNIPADFLIVRGASKDEIIGFESYLHNLMDEHSTALFVLICDENLDYFDPESNTNRTLKGSEMISRLCDLLGDLEHNLLAVVRSANDSKEDLERFIKLTDGFLCKSKMKKIQIQATLAPLWFSKFGVRCSSKQQEATQDVGIEICNDVALELEEVVNKIRNNIVDWKQKWSQLHHAKGALMLLEGHCNLAIGDKASELSALIDSLRNVNAPPSSDLHAVLDQLWTLARDLN